MAHPGQAGMPEPPDDGDPRTEPLDVAPLMSMADLDRELHAIAEDARRTAAARSERAALVRPAIGDWHFTPARRRRSFRPTKRVAIATGVCTAALALIAGGWALLGGDDDAAPTPPVTHRNADAESKLTALLPAGYPTKACNPVKPTMGAIAEIHCGRNVYAYGPESASYSLFNDQAALAGAFDQAVKAGNPVVCPGNIMSPGPWRKSSAPDVLAGTLLCTQVNDTPTVAWSTTDELLLTTVSDPGGFDQLNAWWTTHS